MTRISTIREYHARLDVLEQRTAELGEDELRSELDALVDYERRVLGEYEDIHQALCTDT